MPAGGEVLVDGQYTITWNGTSMGIFEGDAGLPTIGQTSFEEAVNSTDKYAKSRIDGIYQGADFFFQATAIEYKSGSIAAWWPYGAMGVMGIIGRLRYDMSAALVLTAIAGTPAASSPATITSSHTILQASFPTQLLYGPTLRKLPIRQDMYPYVSGSVVWFTQT